MREEVSHHAMHAILIAFIQMNIVVFLVLSVLLL